MLLTAVEVKSSIITKRKPAAKGGVSNGDIVTHSRHAVF